MGSWPKIIRDPVHNLVLFEDNECDRLLLRLINTREFQRLRRIKQLGFSQLTFPGADHSRFAHSIGVMHIAKRMLERVSRVCEHCCDDDQRKVVLAAALLHDVGHGPFSHAFEKITGDNHEKRTREIILSDQTEVNRVLKSDSSDLPERIKVFFDTDDSSVETALASPYLTQVVSSQLDADRFDYLLRDSYSTGSDSGRFDLDWLIQNLEVDSQRRRFFLQSKALFAAESYVFARHHMYRTVYYHKTTRSAEVMLKSLFRRYKQLLAASTNEAKQKAVAPDAPPSVRRAFLSNIELGEYLQLDDHTMTEFAKACTRSKDSVLSELASGLLNRQLFKAIDVTAAGVHTVADFQETARQIIDKHNGLQSEFHFIVDTPSDTAYKPYDPDAEFPATQIYIQGSGGRTSELSKISDSVASLTRKYTLTRYYFPESVRELIQSEAFRLLKGD